MTLCDAFKLWVTDTYIEPTKFQAFKAAFRYFDEQGWLQHTDECDYRVGSGGKFTKCKCGLEQARKEAGQ